MKTKMIVLVGMLFTQIVFTSNNVYGEDVMAIMKDRHKVHLITHKEANLQRSTLLVACGYIEESQLFLNFNSSLENRKIQVLLSLSFWKGILIVLTFILEGKIDFN